MEKEVKKISVFSDNKTEVITKEKLENITDGKDIDYTYDSPFKKLFKNKVFLSPILKISYQSMRILN